MPRTYRNRPDHRSAAFRAVILLLLAAAFLAVPAAASTAAFTVSENGSILSVDAKLVNQDTYFLVMPGFLGEDAELTNVQNLTLKDENGTIVETKQTKTKLTFPKGNYTLTYSTKIEGGLVYAKFPEPYNAIVHLPDPYTTGHLILGSAGSGAVTPMDDGTVVTFKNTKAISMNFYDKGREPMLYWFIAGWLVVLGFVLIRHLRIRNQQTKIE
ncbi:MAG: hypothetical protein Q4Q04_04250 [Methanocorpusculum sp.]|nr:hypothetical protein [Methanocorpusculum sp.]